MTNYFNAYQLKAGQTATFPDAGDVESMTGLFYVAMGLAGEAGEILGKVKKDPPRQRRVDHRRAPGRPIGGAERRAPVRSTAGHPARHRAGDGGQPGPRQAGQPHNLSTAHGGERIGSSVGGFSAVCRQHTTREGIER